LIIKHENKKNTIWMAFSLSGLLSNRSLSKIASGGRYELRLRLTCTWFQQIIEVNNSFEVQVKFRLQSTEKMMVVA